MAGDVQTESLTKKVDIVTDDVEGPPRDGCPPKPNGELLAAVGRRGASLMLHASHCNGHPFGQLRLWKRDRARRLWPDQGVSIRLSELPEIVRGLHLLAERNGIDLEERD